MAMVQGKHARFYNTAQLVIQRPVEASCIYRVLHTMYVGLCGDHWPAGGGGGIGPR